MKKLIALICVIAMVLSFGVVAFASADSRGDVTADGKVSLEDVMEAVKYVAQKQGVNDMTDPYALDVNQDYVLNLEDVMTIIKLVAGKVESFSEFNAEFDYHILANTYGITK